MRKRAGYQSRDWGLIAPVYCLAASFGLLTAGLAAAQNHVEGAPQGQNRDLPIHIQAETLEINDKVKTATFLGNVQVVQGDTTMKCPTLVVFYGPEDGAGNSAGSRPVESQAAPAMPQGGNIRRAEARGGVTVVTKIKMPVVI